MTEGIQECLMTWPEDMFIQLDERILYFSKQGNWHVTDLICEGYRKVIYDGPDGSLALQFLLGLLEAPKLEVRSEVQS